jgi:ABC-type glycerol-3-phosphate transport system substrate-binding protein
VNNGARLFSPDGTKGSGYINSEKAIEAIQGAVDLVRVHKVSRPTLSYFNTRPFSRRKTGMTLEFFLTLFELEPLLQDELGVVGLPSFGSKPKVACSFVNGFGISSTCGNPETAWELIWSLCSNDNAYTRMVSLGGTPSLTALLEDKKYYAEPNRKAIVRELQYAGKEHFPNDPSGNPLPFLQPLINPAIEKILVHGADTRETLNRLAIELDLALEERWEKFR